MAMNLTHLDESGAAGMVDVGGKAVTERMAVARGIVSMQPETIRAIAAGDMKKGDVLTVAQLAGILAGKRTSDLIPLCHPLSLTHLDVKCAINTDANQVEIEAAARTQGQTGVEMEALTAVSVAALTVYDMAKAIDRSISIGDIRLVYKSGGNSGEFRSEDYEG